MKVALVHNFHSSDVPSGENGVVEAEQAALRRAGVEVKVLAADNDAMARDRTHPLRAAITVATGRGLSPLDLLDGFEPDIIHVHNLFPYFGTTWVQDAPAPLVTTLHNFRSLCANGYLFREGEVCTLCPDGRRWSGVRHGCYRGSRLATVPLAVAGRGGPSSDPLLRSSRRLLALSDRAVEVFQRAGVPPAVIERDWHFLPDDLVSGATGVERGDHWLFVGRLTAEKGIDRLVGAWPPDRRLVIVGEGPMRAGLEMAAVGKRVEFRGAASRAAVVREMATAVGVVVPSLWYETFGLVYIEALAVGTPVLAFAPNVVADAVAQEGTGLVAEWGKVAEAVSVATTRFPAIGERCRAVFSARYSEAVFSERRPRLYEAVLG